VIEKLLADLSFACQSVEEKKTLLVPVIDGELSPVELEEKVLRLAL